jgi:hypothetical protein
MNTASFLGLLTLEENTDWGCLKAECSGEYLNLRQNNINRENYIMGRFITCTLHISRSSDGRDIGKREGMCELHTGREFENMKGRVHFRDVGVDGRMVLKLVLER